MWLVCLKTNAVSRNLDSDAEQKHECFLQQPRELFTWIGRVTYLPRKKNNFHLQKQPAERSQRTIPAQGPPGNLIASEQKYPAAHSPPMLKSQFLGGAAQQRAGQLPKHPASLAAGTAGGAGIWQLWSKAGGSRAQSYSSSRATQAPVVFLCSCCQQFYPGLRSRTLFTAYISF